MHVSPDLSELRSVTFLYNLIDETAIIVSIQENDHEFVNRNAYIWLSNWNKTAISEFQQS